MKTPDEVKQWDAPEAPPFLLLSHPSNPNN